MNKSLRHRQIQNLLRLHGDCAVEFLARELTVSEMTIRRDLQELAAQDRIVRTHGRASPADQVHFEFPFLRDAGQNQSEKLAIARRAASLIEDGQSIMLDSGTTTLALAKQLLHRNRLVVITTSIPIAAVLQSAPSVQTILLGGVLRRDAPDLAGPLTESNLDALHADLAFVGADAIGLNGDLFQSSLEVGRMVARMTRRAASAYLVADSSKVGRTALSRFGNASQYSGLITDAGLSPADRKRLEKAGVRVLVADPVDATADVGSNP